MIIIKESELLINLSDKEKEALKCAISTIYLNDKSDYLNGLWDVIIAILGPEICDNGINISNLYSILSNE